MTDETASLIQLLDEYKALGELLREEQTIIIKGEMEGLEPLLAEVSNRMKTIEVKVEAFKGRADFTPHSEETKEEIGLMLKELLHLSHQNEELMGVARRKVGEEMEKIKTGQKLLRAYRCGGLG